MGVYKKIDLILQDSSQLIDLMGKQLRKMEFSHKDDPDPTIAMMRTLLSEFVDLQIELHTLLTNDI